MSGQSRGAIAILRMCIDTDAAAQRAPTRGTPWQPPQRFVTYSIDAGEGTPRTSGSPAFGLAPAGPASSAAAATAAAAQAARSAGASAARGAFRGRRISSRRRLLERGAGGGAPGDGSVPRAAPALLASAGL
jgi:hypothetical protein